jgi:uncharacterized protein
MLEIRPNCERCNCDLAADAEALICSFECTWCPDCVSTFTDGSCPNCGGNLERRPVRPERLLELHPPSTKRVVSEAAAGDSYTAQ